MRCPVCGKNTIKITKQDEYLYKDDYYKIVCCNKDIECSYQLNSIKKEDHIFGIFKYNYNMEESYEKGRKAFLEGENKGLLEHQTWEEGWLFEQQKLQELGELFSSQKLKEEKIEEYKNKLEEVLKFIKKLRNSWHILGWTCRRKIAKYFIDKSLS